MERSENDGIERDNLMISLSFLRNTFPYTEIEPCGAITLDLNNSDEIKRNHHKILPIVPIDPAAEPIVHRSIVKELFWRLPNGLELYIEAEERQPKPTDDLLTIFTRRYPLSWHMAFVESYEFFVLQAKRMENIDICKLAPRPENLFRPFELCPLPSVKVVIIGSGPSHQFNGRHPVATGIPFMAGPNQPMDDSLRNILAEVARDVGVESVEDSDADRGGSDSVGQGAGRQGDLTQWLRQGVLIFDTPLTTMRDKKNAHEGYWDNFSTSIIRTICRFHKAGVVFMLWGGNAQRLKSKITGKHHVLIASSPNATMAVREPFRGCKHFSQTNELLIKQKKTPIRW